MFVFQVPENLLVFGELQARGRGLPSVPWQGPFARGPAHEPGPHAGAQAQEESVGTGINIDSNDMYMMNCY